jgi:hypothetical protein
MTPRRRGFAILVGALMIGLTVAPALAVARGPIVYTLGRTAAFERGCFGACMCPVSEPGRLRGRFVLTPAGFDGLYEHYDVTGVDWVVRLPRGTIHATGSGTYRIGGEFAIVQQLTLDLSLDGGAPQRFDSGVVAGGPRFPAIDLPISLNGMVCFDTVFFVRARPR